MSQKHWLERARDTYKFHRLKVLADEDWKLSDTAKSLRRSLGGICEDIKIAKWLKTHEKELEKFTYVHEALDWIRKKQKEFDTAEID